MIITIYYIYIFNVSQHHEEISVGRTCPCPYDSVDFIFLSFGIMGFIVEL